LLLFKNIFNLKDLERENNALRHQLQKDRPFLGKSASIRSLQGLIRKVAPTLSSVLITGENGTGKELVAQSLHRLSPRYGMPFVEVNCAAIPEELIESELFGHEKGAFTGAVQLRRGKFDLAHGGTLFLDEIGDMSLKTQAKILRILQEQKFERVGGTQTMGVDVRVVAATNKDLRFEIEQGNFREDLFYRLNVISFVVPPLRDRGEDIALLANHFLEFATQMYGKELRKFSDQAYEVLQQYSWPGNVRELKNLMERVVILSPDLENGWISHTELLGHFQEESFVMLMQERLEKEKADPQKLDLQNLRNARQEFEKKFIVKTLEQYAGNISKAAQVLGVERSHLHRKMKSFGIE
jgi:two-component system nitrogen regulation response regulator NtrX